MKRVIYLDSAIADRRAVQDYVIRSSHSVRVGQRFMQKLMAYISHIASLPFHMGVSRVDLAPDLRSTVFQNYVIFFRYAEDRLEIINILEGHRDIPEYFSSTNPE